MKNLVERFVSLNLCTREELMSEKANYFQDTRVTKYALRSNKNCVSHTTLKWRRPFIQLHSRDWSHVTYTTAIFSHRRNTVYNSLKYCLDACKFRSRTFVRTYWGLKKTLAHLFRVYFRSCQLQMKIGVEYKLHTVAYTKITNCAVETAVVITTWMADHGLYYVKDLLSFSKGFWSVFRAVNYTIRRP